MAKVPGLEPVKSRLQHSLTPEMATLLYRCFLLDRLDEVARLEGIEPVLAFTPPGARAQAAALSPPRFRLVPQQGRDLGQRQAALLAGLLADGHTGAIAVGSDSPTLPIEYIADAARVLEAETADLVIGPAADGGYYLIGLTRAEPALFIDIPWSSDRVMDLTMAKARRLALRTHVLPAWFDVDTESDLRRLDQEVRASPGNGPRRTTRCLRVIYG